MKRDLDPIAHHLVDATHSVEGTLDEPVGLPVMGAMAALALLAALGGLCFGAWKLGAWLLA